MTLSRAGRLSQPCPCEQEHIRHHSQSWCKTRLTSLMHTTLIRRQVHHHFVIILYISRCQHPGDRICLPQRFHIIGVSGFIPTVCPCLDYWNPTYSLEKMTLSVSPRFGLRLETLTLNVHCVSNNGNIAALLSL